MKYKYNFDVDDIGVEYADSGRWRSYGFSTYGSNAHECLDNATISEVDQDGGELRCYGIDDAGNTVAAAVVNIIEEKCQESTQKIQLDDYNTGC